MNIRELADEAAKYSAIMALPTGQSGNELFIEKFAELIAAHEREECAKLCFSIWNKWLDTPEEDRYKVLYDAEDCAKAIRARGKT